MMKRIEDVRGAVIAEARGRSCGECSMCCNLLEIKTPELRKLANQRCRHCLPGKGCAIYKRRPPVCRTFACLWLIDSRIGEHWQPTRSNMMLNADDNKVFVVVDPAHPDAWRREPFHRDLKVMALYFVQKKKPWLVPQVVIGKRNFLVLPHNEVEITNRKYFTVLLTGPDTAEVVFFRSEKKAKEWAARGKEIAARAKNLLEGLEFAEWLIREFELESLNEAEYQPNPTSGG